jgi:hypothetical protein
MFIGPHAVDIVRGLATADDTSFSAAFKKL